MISNKALLSLLAALVLPVAAIADDDINYTFLDVKYVDNGINESYSETSGGESLRVDLDGGGGFAVDGSLALHDNWHVFAEYCATDVDLSAFATIDDIDESLTIGGDVDDWRIGVGYNMALTPDLDGVFQLAWEDRSVDFGSATILGESVDLDVDDDGFAAMVGLRANVSEKFELNGHVQYTQVRGLDLAAEAEDDILDDDMIFAVGGVFHLSDLFSLGANIEAGDSSGTAWNAFARVGFGS